ncbi:hypothetical protein VNI00_015119 [Paramarasmius palmivorus]|uniref:Uncharacterized protein n=1 Tax=Paramarasmius palmivorus TaxID=297713 RepID=A0AAW0BN38_9AGAR
MSRPPFGEPTSSEARPANVSNLASQNIGRIVGPVVGVVVLIILVAVSIVILKRRRRGTLPPTEPPKVSPYPNTTSASNDVITGKEQPELEGVDQKLDVTRTLLGLEDPTREEASSSIGNDDLPHQEYRE